MYAEYMSNSWFTVDEQVDCWRIQTPTVDGDVVAILIRKKSPYCKHMKSLVEELKVISTGSNSLIRPKEGAKQ